MQNGQEQEQVSLYQHQMLEVVIHSLVGIQHVVEELRLEMQAQVILQQQLQLYVHYGLR